MTNGPQPSTVGHKISQSKAHAPNGDTFVKKDIDSRRSVELVGGQEKDMHYKSDVSGEKEFCGWHDLALPWDQSKQNFFEDRDLKSIYSRALSYLDAGIAVRFQGPAGVGKTAMALRVAHARRRPITFLSGHDGLSPRDLIGFENGHHTTRLDDTYIASVRKTETRVSNGWSNGVLLEAMLQGNTLIYDEFTRAPPEANVPLLSALEEGVIVVSHPVEGWHSVKAHPDFRILLTSNPADYLGTNGAPDALEDRMLTFEFSSFAEETRSHIISCATGLSRAEADVIVSVLAELQRSDDQIMSASLRAGLLISRILAFQGVAADPSDPHFIQIAADVVRGRLKRADTEVAVRQACMAVLDRTPNGIDSLSHSSQSAAQ